MILIIEDDLSVGRLITRVLEKQGYKTKQIAHWDSIETSINHLPNLIILDINLAETSGYKVFAEIKTKWPQMPVLLTSGRRDPEISELLTQENVTFVEKPFSNSSLLKLVKNYINLNQTSQQAQ